MENLFRWSKLIEPEEESTWETRLVMDDIMSSTEKLVSRKRCRISSYCETRKQAEDLKSRYGGGVTKIVPQDWEPAIDPETARVLRIRDRFIVSETDDGDAVAKLGAENPGREILSFPPQLAFGTGGHPTTANCLRLLVDAAERQSAPWRVLDLGCGSGILSVAAAKLGAEKAVAVEFDRMALGYAEQNGLRHDVADRIDFMHADVLEMLPEPPEIAFDVMAANLFSDLLIEILPLLGGWLKPGGDLILSGFLTSQAKQVNDQAKKCGFPLDTFLRRGKWVAAAGKKS